MWDRIKGTRHIALSSRQCMAMSSVPYVAKGIPRPCLALPAMKDKRYRHRKVKNSKEEALTKKKVESRSLASKFEPST